MSTPGTWYRSGLRDGAGPEDPVACYERAAAHRPVPLLGALRPGNARRSTGDHQAALGHYDSAIRCQTRNPMRGTGRAFPGLGLGRHREAIRSITRHRTGRRFPAVLLRPRKFAARTRPCRCRRRGYRAAAEDTSPAGTESRQGRTRQGRPRRSHLRPGTLLPSNSGCYEEAVGQSSDEAHRRRTRGGMRTGTTKARALSRPADA